MRVMGAQSVPEWRETTVFASRYSRFIALAGAIAWLAVIVVSDVFVAPSPAYDAPPAEWSTYLQDHSAGSDEALLYAEVFLLALAGVFVGLVCAVLRRAEGDRGFLSTMALLFGGVAIAIKVGSGAPILAAIYLNESGLSGEMTRTLFNMNDAAFVLTFFANGAMMLAIGAAVLLYRAMPAWLGWLGLAAGLALLAGAPFVTDDGPGFIGMGLFLLWNIAASITLFVKWPSYVTGFDGVETEPTRPGVAGAAPA
ncbi:MAG: hypothetical protein ACKVT1_09245 [Dehalococcoidia bacterium]